MGRSVGARQALAPAIALAGTGTLASIIGRAGAIYRRTVPASFASILRSGRRVITTRSSCGCWTRRRSLLGIMHAYIGGGSVFGMLRSCASWIVTTRARELGRLRASSGEARCERRDEGRSRRARSAYGDRLTARFSGGFAGCHVGSGGCGASCRGWRPTALAPPCAPYRQGGGKRMTLMRLPATIMAAGLAGVDGPNLGGSTGGSTR